MKTWVIGQISLGAGTSGGTECEVLTHTSWEKVAAPWGGGGGIRHSPFTQAASLAPSYDHVGGRDLPCFTQEVMSWWLFTL